jgi:hypothetical protein
VEIYVDCAYHGAAPPAATALAPPGQFVPAQWLMSANVERTPPTAPAPEACRSFALRLGNRTYPHMKLRIARLPNGDGYIFRVDTHDAMLQALSGSSDAPLLAELKERNAALAVTICNAWEAEGLPTERTYLRAQIAELKAARVANTAVASRRNSPRRQGPRDFI